MVLCATIKQNLGNLIFKMNYIQQAYKGLHEWWRYLVGFIIIDIAWQFLGAIPLIVALFSAMGFEEIAKGNMPSDISFMAELLGNNLFLFLATERPPMAAPEAASILPPKT